MEAEQIQQLRDILCSTYQENVNENLRDIWREINGMKKMIMTAMAGVILQVAVFIGAVVLEFIRKG
jgi:hypothetical protein